MGGKEREEEDRKREGQKGSWVGERGGSEESKAVRNWLMWVAS